MNSMFKDFEVVHSYSRKQAIEDGYLIDVSKLAGEAGFVFPVAVSCAVWENWVCPTDYLHDSGQSLEGRLWDLLIQLRFAIQRQKGSASSRVDFECLFLTDEDKHEVVPFYSVCGPGDAGEPVVTVMLPGED